MRNKVSSQGRITVPKAVRHRLGLRPGSHVSIEIVGDGYALLKQAKKWSVDDMAGFLKAYGKDKPAPKSVYRKEIAKRLAERDQRTKGELC